MSSPSAGRRAPLALLLQFAAAAVLVAGCGGGGGGGGTGSQTTGPLSFTTGTINGFGSVIVNGVRFDNSAATTTDDDDNAVSSSSLLLGMRAEVTAGAIANDANGNPIARAIAIHLGDQVLGPVTAIDTTADTLVVLGQNVNVLDTTVIDESLANGLASITAGMVLEVYGTRDMTTGAIDATRIQVRTPPIYRVKGPIASLDTTAHTFMIGGALVNYANASPVPANLFNGELVAARLQTTPSNGAWVANAVITPRPLILDADTVDVEGIVTAFVSPQSFFVNSIPVNANNATFPDGTTGIVLGARVEVQGSASNGTITATSVSIDDQARVRARGFELHGQIGNLDTTAKTFVLRGIMVDWSLPNLVFKNGTAAQLANGAQLEVKGLLSADGNTLKAVLIAFGD
jgi:hypothetical protein